MGRYIGSTCRKARRVGCDLVLKSFFGKPLKDKCNLLVFPGQHGSKKKKQSDYALQLTAKQMFRFTYCISEKQLYNYYKKSYKMLGSTGFNLFLFLERRLDNIVFRMGFASTRAEARQLIAHRFICVKRSIHLHKSIVTIPSYLVNVSDTIFLTENAIKQKRILDSLNNYSDSKNFSWLKIDKNNFCGLVLRYPIREELSGILNERLVVEFYSR